MGSDFKVVATRCQPGETGPTVKTACMGLYPNNNAQEPCDNESTHAADWFNIEIPIECKADSIEQDPFDDKIGRAHV